jgi:hypothetical protein
MKSIFEKEVREELIQRIAKLSDSSAASWGKMNVYQMIVHCIKTEEMYLRITSYKRLFIGRIFGQMSLKSLVKDDAHFKRNEPTHPTFKITDNGYISSISEKWISLIRQFDNKTESDYEDFSHPFFGKMSYEQVGHYNYKHIDHHLRQFNL